MVCSCSQSLRGDIERHFNADTFSWDEVLCNDAAGLLKQFIRELPAPLLTFQFIDAFIQVDSEYCAWVCVRVVWACVWVCGLVVCVCVCVCVASGVCVRACGVCVCACNVFGGSWNILRVCVCVCACVCI